MSGEKYGYNDHHDLDDDEYEPCSKKIVTVLFKCTFMLYLRSKRV
jgi:hypothetical protein